MFKLMWLLRRKKGTTFEQFQHHYETSHAVLGQKYFGHLILEYKRNYNISRRNEGEPAHNSLDYDCITEWVLPNEAAFTELMAVLGDPRIRKIFLDDEERFLDQDSVKYVPCETRDTGSGDGAEALKLLGTPFS